MAKIKSLFRGAKKAVEEAEKGVSRRVGAAGDKGVRIEKGSKVGKATGGMKDTKTGRVLTKEQTKAVTSRGRKRIVGAGAAGAGAAALSGAGGGDKKKSGGEKKKDFTKGVSRGGVPFKEAFAKARKDGKKTFMWNDKKYTTELASEKKKAPAKKASPKKKRGLLFGKDAKIRPFGGAIARALLGEDEKFGGDRGAIDFVRPKKKSNGGEMKKKGYSTGGAAGLSPTQQRMLRSAQRHAQNTGQNPAELQRLTAQYGDLNAAQRRAMAEAKKKKRQAGRRGAMPKMQGGGMMKSKMASKGGKMGGKIPPGMKKGGAVRKKARGVGAAKRGFGKAMR